MFLVWVNEVGKTEEERDFENGGNTQFGVRYVEFELPSEYQMNIL